MNNTSKETTVTIWVKESSFHKLLYELSIIDSLETDYLIDGVIEWSTKNDYINSITLNIPIKTFLEFQSIYDKSINWYNRR